MSRPVLSEVDVQALIAACETPQERLIVGLGLLRGARAGEVGALAHEPLHPRLVQFRFQRVARRAGVEAVYHDLRRAWRSRKGVTP